MASTTCLKRMSFILLLVCCGLSVGCPAQLSPTAPEVFSTRKNYSYDNYTNDKRAYDTAIENNEILKATKHRNNMLWSIINDIDYSYNTFKAVFYRNRAMIETISDLAQLGLSTAATALGGSAILSAALTALKGAELSVDKNYFRERTSEALFIKMDSLREIQIAEIQKKLILSAPSYDFEEAYRDTLKLFSAGTIPAAIQSIAADAGDKQAKAQEEIKTAIEKRIRATLPETTLDMISTKKQLTDALKPLSADPVVAFPKVNKALKALNVEVSSNPADALSQLQAQVRNARAEDEIDRVRKAFIEADILQ